MSCFQSHEPNNKDFSFQWGEGKDHWEVWSWCLLPPMLVKGSGPHSPALKTAALIWSCPSYWPSVASRKDVLHPRCLLGIIPQAVLTPELGWELLGSSLVGPGQICAKDRDSNTTYFSYHKRSIFVLFSSLWNCQFITTRNKYTCKIEPKAGMGGW